MKNSSRSLFCGLSTGFFLHFAFLACFFWLNVMCFDIWRTFSVFRGAQHSSGRSGELRRFLLYSLYAWGSPLLLLGVTVLGQLFAGRWHIINPAMGENSCYFGTTVAKYAYFCAPVAVLLLVNLCLFLHTAVRIVQLQRETSALKSAESQRHSAERQRYHVYLKLFLIMGVNWVAEIISNLFPEPSYLWMLSDVTNSLQGILIFILFVGTGRVRRIVLRRGVTHNTSSYATKTSRLTATMGNGNGAVCNGASRASMVGPGPGPGVLEPASPETTVSPTLASPEATESPALASSAATMSPAHLDPVSPAAAEAGAVPSVAPFPSSRSPPAPAPAPAPPAGAASAASCVDEDMEDIALMDLTAGARPVPTSPCGGPSLPLATTTAEPLAEENVSSPRALPDCVLDSLKTVGGVPRAVEGNGRTGLEPAVARSQIPMSVVPDR
ncbi:G-protein coupled receptor Mth2 [Frankliniella fusca]|uniref:G-protein coupled receptor Mth2 n=1 Tax=Frankliniella fusca TaxID=407009 RepID=A0AAE1I2Z4_9NEOP|nr:G-protein coupled receptor Mth2 [Frankliniella fusca]